MPRATLFVILAATMQLAFPADPPSGEALYQKHCAACHEQATPRIPPRSALQNLSSARILRVMNSGAMMTIAYPLKRDEREAVAAYLGKAGPEPGPPANAFCSDRKVTLSAAGSDNSKLQWNGWSPTTANTRFQP